MIHNSFTTYAISLYTHRHCVRFTELAYVVVAVFDSGRPQFISKRKLHHDVVRRECLNDGKLQAEWKIGILSAATAKKEIAKPFPFKRIAHRLNRAGFDLVEIKADRVEGVVPSGYFERTVALQIAKENHWEIVGDRVIVAVI